jgi:hypothetical protein
MASAERLFGTTCDMKPLDARVAHASPVVT